MANILIVDDDASIVRVMTIWLERHGHHVLSAAHGGEALILIEHQPVDLIISDMNMPVLNGLGLAKAVRERGLTTVPLLLLTARCDQDKLTQELEQYHVHVFPKPFIPSKLVMEISRLLSAVTSAQE